MGNRREEGKKQKLTGKGHMLSHAHPCFKKQTLESLSGSSAVHVVFIFLTLQKLTWCPGILWSDL